MARLINPIFGNLSGRLKDVVFRTRNGKTYVCSRPHVLKEPSSNAIKSRTKFTFTAKLAKSITEAAHASEAWKNEISEDKSVFNGVFSSVYPSINENAISDKVSVYPVINSKLNLDSDSFTLSFKNNTIIAALSKNKVCEITDTPVKYLQMSVIIYCSEPNLFNIKPYFFLNLNSKLKTASKNGCFRFSINPCSDSSRDGCLSERDIQVYYKYDKHDVLIAFAALDKNMNLLEHSKTLYFSNIK